MIKDKLTLFIGGGLRHFDEVKEFILKNISIMHHKLIVFDAFNNCKWNSGRVNYIYDIPFNIDLVRKYNKLGIGVYTNFSNSKIDLMDPVGNNILKVLNTTNLNGVIIQNEGLFNYIKKYYPNLKLSYSIIGFPNDYNIENIDLSKLEKYDYICPRYEYLKGIKFNKDKVEIMINDRCKFNCEIFHDHFELISMVNRMQVKNKHYLNNIQQCIISNKCYPDMDKDEVQNFINKGYKVFKISGRSFINNDTYKNSCLDYLKYFL